MSVTAHEEYRRLETDIQYFYQKFFATELEPDLWAYQKQVAIDIMNPSYQEYGVLKGRQIGMSWFMGIVALHHAMMHENSTVLLVSFNLEQAQHILNYGKQFLGRLKHKGMYESVVEGASMKNIRLNNGSKIIALGCTVPDANNVRGFIAHLLIIDEAAFIYDKMFGAINPTTSNTKGKTIYLSTAGSVGSQFYRVWDDGRNAEKWRDQLDKGYDLSITYEDLPKIKSYTIPSTEILSDEVLARALRTLKSMKYNREYMCQWAGTADQVFSKIPLFVDRKMPTKSGKPCFAGIDVGKVNDPTVLVIIEAFFAEGQFLDSDGIRKSIDIPYRVVKMKWWEREGMRAIANDIKINLHGRYPVGLYSIDATGGYGDELLQYMVEAELPVRGTKVKLIKKNELMLGSPANKGLGDAFEEELLWLNNESTDTDSYELLFELNAYTGKVTRNGHYIFDSSVGRDHAVDALAHAWSSVNAGTFDPYMSTRRRA